MSDITLGPYSMAHPHPPVKEVVLHEEPNKVARISGDYLHITGHTGHVVMDMKAALKLAKFLNENLVLDVMGDL